MRLDRTALSTLRGRPVPRFLPPLPLAVGLVALVPFAAVRAAVLPVHLANGHGGLDFAEYWVAARIGWEHGWAAVYDVHRFSAALQIQTQYPDGFSNLPGVAWLALPLIGLPFITAQVVWMAFLVPAFMASLVLAARGSGWVKTLAVVSGLGSYSLLFAIDLGQYLVVVALLLALHRWLEDRERHVLAGVVLGLAFLKPQDVLLVPAALLLSGRPRTAVACVLTVAALFAAMALALGPDGIAAYRGSVDYGLANPDYVKHTLAAHLPDWLPALPVLAALAAVALVPALFTGACRYETALAAAVTGSLLVTPYLNLQDLGLLIVCGWMLVGPDAPPWVRPALALSYPLVALLDKVGPVPVIGLEVVWLLALAWESLAPRPARRPAARAASALGPAR